MTRDPYLLPGRLRLYASQIGHGQVFRMDLEASAARLEKFERALQTIVRLEGGITYEDDAGMLKDALNIALEALEA